MEQNSLKVQMRPDSSIGRSAKPFQIRYCSVKHAIFHQMKLSDLTFSDVTVLLSLTMFLHQVVDRILRRNLENLEMP